MTDHAVENTVKTFGNPPIPVEDVVDEEGNTYCQVHTDVETGLRCNNCERVMCAKCAVHTPVGYRCEQCVRQLEDRFFNADQMYYIKLGAVTAVGGAIGAFIASFVGFFLFVFFIAVVAGGIISEAATRFIKGQRGRQAGPVAVGGIIAGTLIMIGILSAGTVNQITGAAMEELMAQVSREDARQIMAQAGMGQFDLFFTVFRARLFSFSMLLYVGITAFTVYGRFNIYGGRRRR